MDLLTVGRDILSMFGITLIGITTGELLHRVGLLVDTRHSSHISQVVNMKDVPWYLLVTVLGLLIMMMTGDNINMIMIIKLMSVSMVWSIIRVTGVMDNAVDDLKIFKERSAELGPGLATNYWFGFLQTVLLSDDVSDGDGLNIREKLVEYHDQHHYPDQHLCSDKIVILIQTNCDFHPDTLQAENVYKTDHDVVFNYRDQRKRLTVYWINATDDDDGQKLFFVFDFPQILKSSMGPGRGWGESRRPGARRNNIDTFRQTLSRLAKKKHKSRMISYVKYNINDPDRKPLDQLIREALLNS